MKPFEFEEKFTAWLDGQLSREEATAFEQELSTRGFDPAAERHAGAELGKFLRSHSPAPQLANPDFFNHQILHRIELEQPITRPATRGFWWSLPRLAAAGAFCLLIAAALFYTLVPYGASAVDHSPYFAEVIDARPMDDTLSADTIYTARDNVTVVWIGGLDYLPAEYQLQ